MRITARDGFNDAAWHCVSRESSLVAQLGAATDRENAPCNEAGLCRNQENRSVSDHIAMRAIAKKMDFIEVFANTRRIGLLPAPSFEHWSPNSRRTNCVHPDGISGVVSSHGLGERDHRALGRNVGRMIFLPHESHHACGIENGSLACSQSIESIPGGPIDGLHIDSLQVIPFCFAGFVQWF